MRRPAEGQAWGRNGQGRVQGRIGLRGMGFRCIGLSGLGFRWLWV